MGCGWCFKGVKGYREQRLGVWPLCAAPRCRRLSAVYEPPYIHGAVALRRYRVCKQARSIRGLSEHVVKGTNISTDATYIPKGTESRLLELRPRLFHIGRTLTSLGQDYPIGWHRVNDPGSAPLNMSITRFIHLATLVSLSDRPRGRYRYGSYSMICASGFVLFMFYIFSGLVPGPRPGTPRNSPTSLQTSRDHGLLREFGRRGVYELWNTASVMMKFGG